MSMSLLVFIETGGWIPLLEHGLLETSTEIGESQFSTFSFRCKTTVGCVLYTKKEANCLVELRINLCVLCFTKITGFY